VAKKLSDIKKGVKDKELEFFDYLVSISPDEVLQFIEEVKLNVDIYVFSGIIRNYFLKVKEVRDFDFVVEDVSKIRHIIEKYDYKINSFDGYKISIGSFNIDLWETEKTWAFKYQDLIKYELYKAIPNTSFFNFSSIIYHINNKEFIFNEDFLRFLRDKNIEMSYAPNPNYELCLINTVYYSEKYNLKVGSNLKSFIKDYFYSVNTNFPDIQIKHFGKVIYSKEELNKRINLILQTNKAFQADSNSK